MRQLFREITLLSSIIQYNLWFCNRKSKKSIVLCVIYTVWFLCRLPKGSLCRWKHRLLWSCFPKKEKLQGAIAYMWSETEWHSNVRNTLSVGECTKISIKIALGDRFIGTEVSKRDFYWKVLDHDLIHQIMRASFQEARSSRSTHDQSGLREARRGEYFR